MITTEEINEALNVFNTLTVDYEDRTADEIEELDKALDTIQLAAQKFANLGADYHERSEQDRRNREYARGYAEAREAVESIIEGQGDLFQITNADLTNCDVITIHPKKGEPVEYERARSRGYWEKPEPEDYKPMVPARVCSECRKAIFYPGKYCSNCGAYNKGEE